MLWPCVCACMCLYDVPFDFVFVKICPHSLVLSSVRLYAMFCGSFNVLGLQSKANHLPNIQGIVVEYVYLPMRAEKLAWWFDGNVCACGRSNWIIQISRSLLKYAMDDSFAHPTVHLVAHNVWVRVCCACIYIFDWNSGDSGWSRHRYLFHRKHFVYTWLSQSSAASTAAAATSNDFVFLYMQKHLHQKCKSLRYCW